MESITFAVYCLLPLLLLDACARARRTQATIVHRTHSIRLPCNDFCAGMAFVIFGFLCSSYFMWAFCDLALYVHSQCRLSNAFCIVLSPSILLLPITFNKPNATYAHIIRFASIPQSENFRTWCSFVANSKPGLTVYNFLSLPKNATLNAWKGFPSSAGHCSRVWVQRWRHLSHSTTWLPINNKPKRCYEWGIGSFNEHKDH